MEIYFSKRKEKWKHLLFVQILLKYKLHWNNGTTQLLCQSYDYIFLLNHFLLFTAMAPHSDHFMNLSKWNETEQHCKASCGCQATRPEMERIEAEKNITIWKDFIYKMMNDTAMNDDRIQ
jgi:hypothetical protein